MVLWMLWYDLWVIEVIIVFNGVPSVIWGRMFPSGGYCKEPQNELRGLDPNMYLKGLKYVYKVFWSMYG